MVNSNTLDSSYGSGLNGKPHSKRSGPSGENQRKPKPHDVRSVREAVDAVEAGADLGILDRDAAGLAVVFLEVPGVAGVGEDDAAQAHRFDDRELELEVLEVLQVAADVRAVRDREAVRIGLRREADARADGAVAEAAHVEDAAQEEAREDRHALVDGLVTCPALDVELEHEALAERVVEAADAAVCVRNSFSEPRYFVASSLEPSR